MLTKTAHPHPSDIVTCAVMLHNEPQYAANTSQKLLLLSVVAIASDVLAREYFQCNLIELIGDLTRHERQLCCEAQDQLQKLKSYRFA